MPKDEAYKQAEQKIQQALQSGATELDLRSMKLTELPESIGQLTQLTKLDLSNTQETFFEHFSFWLASLGRLAIIHVD
ncbi:MAG: hypothetical protein HY865_10495 [Chloroflexi bacterium]|nr:hypothetical protein [Chloroflexota bacterium]